jgi:hypothetical protein
MLSDVSNDFSVVLWLAKILSLPAEEAKAAACRTCCLIIVEDVSERIWIMISSAQVIFHIF